MPYYTKKLGEHKYCVYKENDNSLVGCTTSEEKLKKYLEALHANENKKNKNMKNYKFIKNIDENKREATILLYKPIGSFYDSETGEMTEGIDGYEFAKELRFLEDMVDTIHVRINSVGGLVLDGWSIISAILNSKVEIITYNDGLAASIAGLIFASGHKRMAMDYSILMIHNPFGGSEEALNKIRESLLTILENSSILDKDELDNLMENESYLTCLEAKKMGFVDEIIESKNPIKLETKNLTDIFKVFNSLIEKENMKKTKNKVEEQITDTVIEATNEVEAIVDEVENSEIEKVEEVIVPDAKATFINSLNVSLKTSFDKDDEILNHISSTLSELKETKDKFNALQNELKNVTDELNKMRKDAEEAKKARIDEMVNSLYTSGKISKEEIANVKKLAEVDFETTKNCFDKIGLKKTASITSTINSQNSISNSDSRANWTLKDYWKKDPKELERIKNEMPTVYQQLVDDFNKQK